MERFSDHQNRFLEVINNAHNNNKKRRRREMIRRMDFSLYNARKFEPTNKCCNCLRCNGNYRLLTWSGRRAYKWPELVGTCPFSVAIHIMRISSLAKKIVPDNLVYKMLEIAK